jgi:hypothetical protein
MKILLTSLLRRFKPKFEKGFGGGYEKTLDAL